MGSDGRKRWLRLYTNFFDNEKFMGFTDSELMDYVALLVLARLSPSPGWVTIPVENAAYRTRRNPRHFAASLKRFEEQPEDLQLIRTTPEGIEVLNFIELQYDNPSDVPDSVAARVRRHRAREAAASCNEDVTTLKRDVTPRSDQIRSDQIRSEENKEGGAAAQIMLHYNATFAGPSGPFKKPLRLTTDRRAKIQTRLKTFTVEELCQAITNIRGSPWHCGDNPSHKVYGTPEFLCANDGKVDDWLHYEGVGAGGAAPGRHPEADDDFDWDGGDYIAADGTKMSNVRDRDQAPPDKPSGRTQVDRPRLPGVPRPAGGGGREAPTGVTPKPAPGEIPDAVAGMGIAAGPSGQDVSQLRPP